MVLQQLDQACANKTNLHIYLMSEIYSGINLRCQEKYPHHHIVSSEFDHPALAADNNIPIENVQKLKIKIIKICPPINGDVQNVAIIIEE